MSTQRTPFRTFLVTTALAAVLATGACSGSDQSEPGVPDETVAGGTMEPALGAPDGPTGSEDPGALGLDDAEARDATGAGEAAVGSTGADGAPDPRQRTVIATGTMTLQADDVADARLDVQEVLDAHGGMISHEETQTDEDGVLARARMVLRIPIEEVAEATAALEEIAELRSSTYGEEDVKTQVLDVEARIRAQQTSVRRIEALLAEAENLRTLLSIEQELTRRQAELDSLKSQQAWLADQTDLATITVHLKRTPDAETDDPDRGGFLGGLVDGWDSFLAALSGTAALVGFALPWLGLLLLAGAAARLVLRRVRRSGAAD